METWSWLVIAFVAYEKIENYVRSMEYRLIFLPAEILKTLLDLMIPQTLKHIYSYRNSIKMDKM